MKNPFDHPPLLSDRGGKPADGKAAGGKEAGSKATEGKAAPEAKNSMAHVSRSSDEPGPAKNDYVARVAASGAAHEEPPAEPLTGKNYTKLYQQQREAELAGQNRVGEDENTKHFEKTREQQRLLEQKQADIYVLRARDLQTQIAIYRQRLGQDPETDRLINVAIQQLVNELNGIPNQYKR
ncbi:MAG TPA: hypothetical protein VMV79_07210 [Alphaproteobacteria bacterium]|nr:hypothetical protein [Alphaproteobacteria bacterium]